MYKEILPSNRFDLVDAFWVYTGNKNTERFKILPDGCADLIFNLTNNTAFVSGVMTKYSIKAMADNSALVGARIKTENFNRITNVPLFEMKNKRLELGAVLPNYNTSFLSQLSQCNADIKRIALLQQLITLTANKLDKPKDNLIFFIAEKIRISKGIVNIQNLATDHYISLRQLERRFKNNLGLTMKEFSRIVRFNESRKSIAEQKQKSLFEIALDMGFYDHAHMVNEFKGIAGEHPSHFR